VTSADSALVAVSSVHVCLMRACVRHDDEPAIAPRHTADAASCGSSASLRAPAAASAVASQTGDAPLQVLSAAAVSPHHLVADGDSGSRCGRRQGSNMPVAR